MDDPLNHPQTDTGLSPPTANPLGQSAMDKTVADDDDEGFSEEPPALEADRDHPLFTPVREALKSVYDPEIPVNIYELGLIYKVGFPEPGRVDVVMTLTAPGCPVAGEMPGWVEEAVLGVDGITSCDVELVWEPLWDPDKMSDIAKVELGFF